MFCLSPFLNGSALGFTLFILRAFFSPFSSLLMIAHFPPRCLLSPAKHDMWDTAIPQVGQWVHFSGLCFSILPSGLLGVDANDFFNLGLPSVTA
jgi:hypothetical protein